MVLLNKTIQLQLTHQYFYLNFSANFYAEYNTYL